MHHISLQLLKHRRLFDPKKIEDLLELKHFIERGRWIDICPFYLEEHWENIPTMCLHKYAVHMLGSVKKPVRKKSKVS